MAKTFSSLPIVLVLLILPLGAATGAAPSGDAEVRLTQRRLVALCLDGIRLAADVRQWRLSPGQHSLAVTMRNEPRPGVPSADPGTATVRFTVERGHHYEIEVRAPAASYATRVWKKGEWTPVVRDRTVDRIASEAPEWNTPSCAAGAASYLLLWAGDAEQQASDFLAVIDVAPGSAQYGRIVTSVPTGVAGAHPHHTEHEMPGTRHLLANGYHAGRTWLFDVSEPLRPTVLTSFGELAGFSHPHTFIRLAGGEVLATFQYSAEPSAPVAEHVHDSQPARVAHRTGGLVLMDERGGVIRSGAAQDDSIPDARIYPYSVLPMPEFDRAVSTTTDMDETNSQATAEWVQFWRLSTLTLLRSIALKPGPRGDENRFTGEPRLLPDGKSVYIHTFNCGLYLIRGVESQEPSAQFVTAFEGKNCGVPVLTGHYWLQTVPDAHALVALDITDPEHPREVSRVSVGDDEQPHWIAIDPAGRRVVLNSAGNASGNRLFLVNFDPATGRLSLDERFRDTDNVRSGINLTGKRWPHGFSGKAVPHGTVFWK
jgi:hypothetical protein